MSASTQITVPAFDGGDSADAEDFISAIRLKAYSEGKQRDQAWILDLVSASLRRDALRWHASLDPSIQNDWGLLQKALLDRFCETFKGIDGVECERFIHSIRRRIFEEGRSTDNEWITTFVSTYVVEDALRWHASLAPEIQEDWKLLQAAMLDCYPPPEVRDRPFKGPTIPLPASAAPAPVRSKKGMIRYVNPSNPSTKTYLGRDSSSHLSLTPNQSDALIAEYDPQGSSNTLNVKNFTTAFDLLGIVWCYAQPVNLSSATNHHSRPVALSHPPSGQITGSYGGYNSDFHSNVWGVTPDGSISMFWTDSTGSRITLLPRVSSNDLIIAGPACKHDQSGYTPGSFVFEAV